MGSSAAHLSLPRGALGLLRATHPLPAAAVTFLVSVVAFSRHARGAALAWVILSTAAGQASVGWSNDYLDRERDREASRTEKPLVSGDLPERVLLISALLAFPLSVALSLPLGPAEAGVMFAAVVSAWLYNAVFKATPLSFLPYGVSFGLAPVYIWLATSDRLPPGWLIVATGVLGVGAHFLNVIPDLEADQATSVRGLPHRLGLRRSLVLSSALLVVVLAIVLAGTVPVTTAQLVAAALAIGLIATVVWAGARGPARIAFRLTIAAAGAIVAVFLLSPSASRL